MMRRLTFLSFVVVAVIAVIAACSDSSTDTPSNGDAGTSGANPSKSVPVKSPPKGDDDDVAPGDDDDVIDDAGSDGSSPKDAGPKDSGPTGPHRYRVFVTKTRYFGDLKTAGGGADGLEGADNLCTKAAADANLGGTWKAWVSTTVKNAGDRIVDRSPWYLVDKTTVAFQDFAGLSAPPLHRIDQNETGSTSITGSGPLNNRVWTGTNNGGVLTPDKNCNDWSDQSQGKATAGAYVETSGAASWTRYALQAEESCNADGGKPWPIYCFEQ